MAALKPNQIGLRTILLVAAILPPVVGAFAGVFGESVQMWALMLLVAPLFILTMVGVTFLLGFLFLALPLSLLGQAIDTLAPLAGALKVESPGQLRQALLHVFDALAGQGFDAGRVVEDFDRDPAAVVDFGERLEDGHEVEIAHAGAAEVGVVGVEVVHQPALLAEDLRD